MGVKELIGMESERKIRYAVVGLGDIAQEDMMPGIDHTGNSEITALITSDPVKADELGTKYRVEVGLQLRTISGSAYLWNFRCNLSGNAELAPRGIYHSRAEGWNTRAHRETSRSLYGQVQGDP